MNGQFMKIKSHATHNHLAYLHNNRLLREHKNHFRKNFHHNCSRLNLHLAQNLRNNGMPSHMIHMSHPSLRSELLAKHIMRWSARAESSRFKMQQKVKIYCCSSFQVHRSTACEMCAEARSIADEWNTKSCSRPTEVGLPK